MKAEKAVVMVAVVKVEVVVVAVVVAVVVLACLPLAMPSSKFAEILKGLHFAIAGSSLCSFECSLSELVPHVMGLVLFPQLAVVTSEPHRRCKWNL